MKTLQNIPNASPEPLVIRDREAAEMLGISRPTLFRNVKAGRLRAVKIGRALRFRRADLESFIESCSTVGAPA